MKKKPPPPPPFWRNPRSLGLMIGLASAVLVAAGAAAIMLNSPGDFSTVPHIKRVTVTSTGESSAPPHAPATAAASTSATGSESPTSEAPAPQSSESAPAPSRSAASSSPRKSPPNPRVELTRNPMSFHPSPIAKP